MLDAWQVNPLVVLCVKDLLEELWTLSLHLLMLEHVFHLMMENLGFMGVVSDFSFE